VRAVLGATAVVVAAGCGGGNGVTRAEWARDADAICAEYERRYDSLGTADELPDLARLLDRAIALLGEERAAIDRLEASKEDEPWVRQLLVHLEKARTAAGRARTAARRGDENAVMVAIGESDSAAAQAQHVARDLGADTCAEP
jgi:hypothetical protein